MGGLDVNARSSIFSTDAGICTDLTPRAVRNANPSILVTDGGMTTFSSSPL